jgi:hypothetical protein
MLNDIHRERTTIRVNITSIKRETKKKTVKIRRLSLSSFGKVTIFTIHTIMVTSAAKIKRRINTGKINANTGVSISNLQINA